MLPNPKKTNYLKKNLGSKAEKYVCSYLIKNGFKILKTNFHSKFGEIDIIAQKSDIIIFVEVKFRNNPKFPISHVINYQKQKKIIQTALNFISNNGLSDFSSRFDVALIVNNLDNYKIDYIKNAFTAESI